jgi:hypothetical protein
MKGMLYMSLANQLREIEDKARKFFTDEDKRKEYINTHQSKLITQTITDLVDLENYGVDTTNMIVDGISIPTS